MRRFLSLFTMMMLSAVLSFAQSRLVTGRVSDESGKPVPFASVVIKNGGGVQSDVNGEYSIRVNPGDILQISGTNYDLVEIPVGSLTNITTVLKLKDNTMSEVVVTSAFNTKRTARSIASNVQNVTGEQMNTVRANNINNALAGKVAGAQVRSQSSAALGRETLIRLRGENGLTPGGGALFVVDGTIMPSANDINPDDVEDVTVLQGPAAAALFGPDGANGAIVINTKRARKGQPGIGIEVNTGVVFDKIYITPNFQNSYAGGANGDLSLYTWQAGQPEAWKVLDGKYYHDYSDDASWGPRMVGQEYIPWYAWYGGHEGAYKTTALTPQPTNAKDFYNTGVTTTNNINFSKASDGYNLRASYTNLDIKGLIPNSFLKRHTLNANFSIDLGTKFTFSTNFNAISQKSNAEENNDGYSNQTTGTFNQWFHRDLDIDKMRELRGLRTPEGVYASWNKANPTAYNASNPKGFYGGNYWMNPYSYFDLIDNNSQRERMFGDVALTYKLNNDFRIKGTYRRQQLAVDNSTIYPTELEISNNQTSFNPWEGTGLAGYGVSNSLSVRQNYELLATYSKKVRDFAINANAGLDILKTKLTGSKQNTLGGLNVPGLYSLSNSKNPINYGQTYSTFGRRGVFVRGDVGYKNMAFVEGTFRRDYTSAEPIGNSIPTYSVGASLVFSDLIQNKSFLSYGKVRGSIGQTILTLSPYELNVLYSPAAQQFNGNFLMGEPNSVPDPGLQGSTNNEKEIGIETRFLRNRFGIDLTYWDRTNKDFPVTVTVPGQSGLSGVRINAGEIAKTGIDIKVFAQPIKWSNLDWNITATWGRLIRNEVVSIAEGITRLPIASGAFSGSSAAYTVSEIGKPWGQMFGGGIKRINGKPELTSAGLFIKEDNVNFGSVLPKYTGGVQNTFNVFKNFVVNVNVDFSYGGKFFSLSDHWGSFSGLAAKTAVLNDRGYSVRDNVADGGGVHVFGVDATGRDVDYYVDAQTYWHQFRNANISEVFIHDLTFVKLREFSLGYKLPVDRMGVSKYIKNATFSIIARNPWLIYSKTKDFDPSEVSNTYGEDGQLPGTRSLGFNLRIGF